MITSCHSKRRVSCHVVNFAHGAHVIEHLLCESSQPARMIMVPPQLYCMSCLHAALSQSASKSVSQDDADVLHEKLRRVSLAKPES